MSAAPESPESSGRTPLARRVGARASLKIRARTGPTRSIWSGLGTFGAIGWSVALPTLAGTALGHWLDGRFPGTRSWTLMLLLAGVVLGCLNAWRWVERENKDMHDSEHSDDET